MSVNKRAGFLIMVYFVLIVCSSAPRKLCDSFRERTPTWGHLSSKCSPDGDSDKKQQEETIPELDLQWWGQMEDMMCSYSSGTPRCRWVKAAGAGASEFRGAGHVKAKESGRTWSHLLSTEEMTNILGKPAGRSHLNKPHLCCPPGWGGCPGLLETSPVWPP